jgi:type I restriction-modification system DNA methylase subunit
MPEQSHQLVQKLWNYCNILRDDGLSYGDYVEQLTFLLFLKMADEQSRGRSISRRRFQETLTGRACSSATAMSWKLTIDMFSNRWAKRKACARNDYIMSAVIR